MTEDLASPTPAPDGEANHGPRRARGIARRERRHNLWAWSYSCGQIAKAVRARIATVRPEIDPALSERQVETPEGFARPPVARLGKALRLARAAIELGELKALAAYLRVVAALDRYHELAAGSPPAVRPAKTPPAIDSPLLEAAPGATGKTQRDSGEPRAKSAAPLELRGAWKCGGSDRDSRARESGETKDK